MSTDAAPDLDIEAKLIEAEVASRDVKIDKLMNDLEGSIINIEKEVNSAIGTLDDMVSTLMEKVDASEQETTVISKHEKIHRAPSRDYTSKLRSIKPDSKNTGRVVKSPKSRSLRRSTRKS